MGCLVKITPSSCLSVVFLVVCTLYRAHIVRGEETTDESVSATAALPSLEETSRAILALPRSVREADGTHEKYPEGCFANGENQCIMAPAAAIRDYLRSLQARLLNISKSKIDFEDKKLKEDLSELGCLAVGIIDLAEVQVAVGLFRQGVVSRVRLDKNALSAFNGHCRGKLLPFSIHQHEKSQDLTPGGHMNERRECSEENVRGHHDPGFACGANGGSLCKHLSIPASSALLGTPMFNGEYQCNPDIYAKRPFACHAGDFTGKLGNGVNFASDESRPDFRLIALDTHGDNACVATENTQSLVLHCQSTNYQIACTPFERVEVAGKRIPDLLRELIRTATLAVPYSRDQMSLLASLVLVKDVERRIEILEKAVPKKPDEEPVSPPENEVTPQ